MSLPGNYPRDGSLPPQPISILKAQSRQESPQTFAHLENFTQKMCPPCLIIIQSCHFDYKSTNPLRLLAAWSAFSWCERATRAKDHRLFYLNYPEINEVGKSYHVDVFRNVMNRRSFPITSLIDSNQLTASPRPQIKNCIYRYLSHISKHNFFFDFRITLGKKHNYFLSKIGPYLNIAIQRKVCRIQGMNEAFSNSCLAIRL